MSRTKGSRNLTKRVQYRCPHCQKKGVIIHTHVLDTSDQYTAACRYCGAFIMAYPYHGREIALQVLATVGKPTR